MSVGIRALSLASVLAFSSTAYAQTGVTSGVSPYASPSIQSGISNPTQPQLPSTTSGVGQFFNSQGGVGIVPGADNSTQVTNKTNATNATSGRGYARARR